VTDLASLLFIAMIPINCKITNFSVHLFTFFVTIIIFCELTSATSNERMTTNIIFVGATSINLHKVHMPVSTVFAYACPVAQCYRQRRR